MGSSREDIVTELWQAEKKYFGMLEFRWSARVAQARSVWSIWFVSFNQTHQTDRTDQMNKKAGGLFQHSARDQPNSLH